MEIQKDNSSKEYCIQLLVRKYHTLGRYPKKSDFTPEQVARIKSFLGPWPRALEASGILPDRSAERTEAKMQKRIERKRKKTQYKIAKQDKKEAGK